MESRSLITVAELGTTLETLEETRSEAVRRLEELGGAGERLGAFRRGGQNLVDSYSEMVPEALEVLPSETRHRIYKILDLTLTTRADGTLLANMVLVEDPQSRAQELASSYQRTPYLLSATEYRRSFVRGLGWVQQSSRRSREGSALA